MKKLLPYILILVVIIGLFSPTIKIHAIDDPLGTCREGTAGQPIQNITQKECTDKGETWIWISYYYTLAPLPCDSGEGCEDGQLKTFDPTQTNNLGAYLNIMIKIFIGLCAILAVIMIVIGGIEYMTSELPGNKEHGKERITGAIFGLVLALGSWTILYQINPDILNTELKSLEAVTVEVALAEAIQSDAGKTLPTGPITGCSSGMQKTNSGMFACGDGNLVQKINSMISNAAANGVNITGGGYRTPEEQKALRIKNCNGDFTNANAQCTPDTALPGASNHNNGKAFDLRCDGIMIQTSDNKCFIWLKANANKYGLFNLPSERWHWSIDGR
ncbi:MAG: D-alanyl-D-alanine carboxypeptidase family protein [Candidatus Paceibacterota bacterium]